MNITAASLAAFVVLSSAATSAPPTEAPAPSRGAEPNALAGPAMPAASASPSLVERDMHGRVRRLEVFPAEAALHLIDLPDETLARARRVLAERAAILDAAVRDHFETLAELFTAGQSGDAPEAVRLAVAFSRHLAPLARRGAVETDLASVLPPSAAARVRALVREYEDALIAEAGKPRFEVLSGEALRLWGEQVRLSFERQSADGAIFFERIIRGLDLRPDQEARVRSIVERYVDETGLHPSREQERRFGLELLAWLDARQALRLMQMIQGFQPKPRPPAPETNTAPAPPEAAPPAPTDAPTDAPKPMGDQ